MSETLRTLDVLARGREVYVGEIAHVNEWPEAFGDAGTEEGGLSPSLFPRSRSPHPPRWGNVPGATARAPGSDAYFDRAETHFSYAFAAVPKVSAKVL